MRPYILGNRPYKRFIKGPCTFITFDLSSFAITTHAGLHDSIDTKGTKNRKNIIVIPGRER